MPQHLHPRKDGYTDQPLYPYNPSSTAAYTFSALFAIAGLLHLILMIPYRAWFPLPMIIGTAMEAGSYYLRSQSHNNTHQLLPFILSTLLIMGAAPMLAATIYMSLKRTAVALDGVDLAPVSLRWVSKLFVLVDVGCFVSQIAGSAMRADAGTLSTGTALVMAGLVTQVVIFVVYIGLVASLHVRLERSMTTRGSGQQGELAWRGVFWGLYCVSGLFLVRNFVRIGEFRQGDGGWLVSSEVPLYVFDGGFMLVIVVVMAVVHPGRLVRRRRRLGKERGVEMDWRDGDGEAFRPLAG